VEFEEIRHHGRDYPQVERYANGNRYLTELV